MARFAPLYEVPIRDASADVRATFFNTEKYDVDHEPAYFEQIDIRLSVDSPAPAQRACHAAQSFRQPIPVQLQVTLIGADLAVD